MHQDVSNAAIAAFEALGGADEHLFAAIGGSLAAGLGHAYSDVDLYLVPRPGRIVDTRVRSEDGYSVQPTVVETSEFARLCGLARRFEATSSNRAQLEEPWDNLSVLVRIAIGEVLYSSPEADEQFRLIRHESIARLLSAKCALEASAYFEDVRGAIISGQATTALEASRIAFLLAVECALAASGDLYVGGPKFVFQRAERTPALAGVFPLLWDLAHPAALWPLNSNEAERVAVSRLGAAGTLLAASLLDGDVGRWSDDLRLEPDGPGPVRSPFYTLVSFADGFGLTGPDVAFRMSKDMAVCWRLLDGRSVDDVAEEMRRHFDAPSIQSTDVFKAVGILRSNGGSDIVTNV